MDAVPSGHLDLLEEIVQNQVLVMILASLGPSWVSW